MQREKETGEPVRFTEDATKMAGAFDITAAEARSAMTGLRAIFGLPQDQVMDLAGAYNHLSNNMDARAADIMRVAERVSGTARVPVLSEPLNQEPSQRSAVAKPETGVC